MPPITLSVAYCTQTGGTAGPQSSAQAQHAGSGSHNSSVLNSIETGAAGSLTEEEAVVQAIQVRNISILLHYGLLLLILSQKE
jgi:hypothetical protein